MCYGEIMATQLPSLYIYVDEQLGGASKALARITGQSHAAFVRRAIRELFVDGRVPEMFVMHGGERSQKFRAHLPTELKEQLFAEAERVGLSASALASGALTTYVARLLNGGRAELHAELARRKNLRPQQSAEGVSP